MTPHLSFSFIVRANFISFSRSPKNENKEWRLFESNCHNFGEFEWICGRCWEATFAEIGVTVDQQLEKLSRCSAVVLRDNQLLEPKDGDAINTLPKKRMYIKRSVRHRINYKMVLVLVAQDAFLQLWMSSRCNGFIFIVIVSFSDMAYFRRITDIKRHCTWTLTRTLLSF